MGIQRLSARGAVNEAIENKLQLAKQSMYRALTRIGEECINYARLHGGYIDQTGNLRSSIGYAIIDNGRIITSKGFKPVKGSKEGAMLGEKFMKEIVSQYSSGISLIVVAGMNYAAAVEAKGYDVISGSQLQADKLAPKILKQLGFRLR